MTFPEGFLRPRASAPTRRTVTSMRLSCVVLLALSAGSVLSPGASAASATVNVFLHENPLHIAPDVLEYAQGTAVTFRVENVAGNAAQHDFLVEGYGVQTARLAAGQVAFLNVTLDRVSTDASPFLYYCTVPGHSEGGQLGTLRVVGEGDGDGGGGKGTPGAGPIAVVSLALALAIARRRGF